MNWKTFVVNAGLGSLLGEAFQAWPWLCFASLNLGTSSLSRGRSSLLASHHGDFRPKLGSRPLSLEDQMKVKQLRKNVPPNLCKHSFECFERCIDFGALDSNFCEITK
ncbi:hypothetical protein Q31b_39130 [Novipirellula aureliae]|uniref:Uncharacterized protein n=1 Tax=Novipirellula aureliae TaxID=2527966 RepID=A0A5C6DRK4_9BACT|nr:hypothetical protein Q31b_39130 [Novipirellula aureliae]